MKNKFKISEELKPYIRQLMARSERKFRIKTEDGQLYLYTDLSGTKFHYIVQRARCMKLTNDTGILHITKRESQDETLVMSLKEEYKTSVYVIAGQEKNK